MEKDSCQGVKNFACFGILFTFILGCLLHFTYKLSGNHLLIGLFTPVNESVWEHLKLLFYAWLFYGLICYQLLKPHIHNYWYGLSLAILCGNLFILILFYTYSGIMGRPILFIDILTYLASCLIAAYVFYKQLCIPKASKCYNILGMIFLIGMILLFAYFTYSPLSIPLFVDFGAKS